MAEPITVDNGALTDYAVLVDDVTDATLGTGAKQLVGIVDATIGGTNKATVSAAGALKVDGSAVTQPVSDAGGSLTVDGTVTVQDGGGSLTVDGTVAVSSIPGTAVEDAASAGGETGVAILGVRNDAAAAKTNLDGDFGMLALDSAGRVGIADLGGTITVDGTLTGITNVVHVDDNAGSLTVDGTLAVTQTGAASNFNATIQGTQAHDTAADANAVGISAYASTAAPAAVSADGDAVRVWADRNGRVQVGDGGGSLTIDDGAGSITVDGTVTANAGSGPFPVSDNAGSLTVDAPVGTPVFVRLSDGAAAITALPVTDNAGSLTVDGTVAISGTVAVTDNASTLSVDDGAGSLTVDAPVGTPVFATITPSTTGGWSKVKYAAQTTTVQTVKGSAGTFGGYYVYNPNASVAYVQVFDNSGTVTLGTTAPDMIFGIPPSSAANLEIANGVNMANAIKLACTTTATGSTAPGTGLDLTVFYK